MFGWLKKLFGRKSKDQATFDFYTPKERYIYRYFDGEKTVLADPLVLHKKVFAKGPEMAVDIKIAGSPLKDAPKAHSSLIKQLREIFSLKPVEDGGLSEVEAVDLLDHFLVYCDVIKKNSSFFQTFAPTPSPAEGGQATSKPSGAGSTASEQSTAQPMPSPSAPA